MYFYKHIPSQGWQIWYEKSEPDMAKSCRECEPGHGSIKNFCPNCGRDLQTEYHIAIMRWTDGLNPEVEQAVEDDARRIAACLNYCEGIDINLLEHGRRTNKPLHQTSDSQRQGV